jgi:hypothetical protein
MFPATLLQQVNSDRVVDTALGISAGGAVVGTTIGQVNQYLQAGAYTVAMISGLCAAYYYVRKARRKDE